MKFNKKIVFPLAAILLLPTLFACNGGGNEQESKHWYQYTEAEKWWNYCSNGEDGVQASREDIGKIVKVTLNNLEHRVRLIDVEHKEPGETTAQAYCTFEFMDVVTKNDVNAFTTYWNNKSGSNSDNHNFITTSDLNDALQDGGDIYSMFSIDAPELLNAMVEVTKYVGIKEGGSYTSNSYTTKLFPLAHDEIVTQSHQQAVSNEGTIYAYYQNHSTDDDRIKKAVNGENGEEYWLRSPVKPAGGIDFYETKVFNIGDSGFVGNSSTCYLFGYAVAPAFCI